MDITAMKVAELKAELSSRGLTTTGTKAILVERLQAAVNESKEGEEPEVEGLPDIPDEEVAAVAGA